MITVVAPSVAFLSSHAAGVHTMAPLSVAIIMITIIIAVTPCRFDDNTCLSQLISPSCLQSPLFGHSEHRCCGGHEHTYVEPTMAIAFSFVEGGRLSSGR